ncbi:zinc finger protein 771-like [Syngnathoides biaculeatus]|uniref:zinc finger protein 771-like n=1 Tax=Syngnathoides biaculeatus TaxID=300417 RepID=UPI002ADDD54B|nr:zinc finger protein 771-like [Syngnathoides biaculeatus]
MCKVTMLRELMKQRLHLAVEEIYQLFERTIMEYEEELSRTKEEKERQGQLLDAVLKSRAVKQQEDTQKVLVRSQEGEEPAAEAPHIKKEEEDVWSGQDGPQPQWPAGEEEEGADEARDERPHSDPDSNFAPLSEMDDNSDSGREKSFRCSFCRKRFSSNGNMKRHMKIHQQTEKVFSCAVCVESFPTRGLLVSHKNRRHTDKNSGEQRFDCAECGKTFATTARLKRHMAKHTGEKPFVCSFCGKRFSLSYILKRHMRSHSSRERFSCPVCAKGFTTKWYIAMHMRTHTGEKPFQCAVCHKQFHFKNGFKKHTCVADSQNAGNEDGGRGRKSSADQ